MTKGFLLNCGMLTASILLPLTSDWGQNGEARKGRGKTDSFSLFLRCCWLLLSGYRLAQLDTQSQHISEAGQSVAEHAVTRLGRVEWWWALWHSKSSAMTAWLPAWTVVVSLYHNNTKVFNESTKSVTHCSLSRLESVAKNPISFSGFTSGLQC